MSAGLALAPETEGTSAPGLPPALGGLPAVLGWQMHSAIPDSCAGLCPHRLLYRVTSPTGLGPTPVSSFSLDHLQ